MNKENVIAERLRTGAAVILGISIVVTIICSGLGAGFNTVFYFIGIGVLINSALLYAICIIVAEIISLLQENNNLLKKLLITNSVKTGNPEEGDIPKNIEKIFSEAAPEPERVEYDETLPTI